jgi:hypothetical protein
MPQSNPTMQTYAVPVTVHWRASSAAEAQDDVTEYLTWASQVIEREAYLRFTAHPAVEMV